MLSDRNVYGMCPQQRSLKSVLPLLLAQPRIFLKQTYWRRRIMQVQSYSMVARQDNQPYSVSLRQACSSIYNQRMFGQESSIYNHYNIFFQRQYLKEVLIYKSYKRNKNPHSKIINLKYSISLEQFRAVTAAQKWKF